MASNVIAEAILVVASVVAASILGAVVIGQLLSLAIDFSDIVKAGSATAKACVEIVYVVYDKDSGLVEVYAKNVGYTSMVLEELTVYFGNLTIGDIYAVKIGNLYAEDLENPNSVWEPGETLVLELDAIAGLEPPYIVKVVAGKAVAEKVFAPPLPG
ncbi:MAG TPA: hypothetical protein EYP08_07550 [Pyrodictiaceae archaeon]|nr:hypothetical protein [Pyrodictiaceae archaeon]